MALIELRITRQGDNKTFAAFFQRFELLLAKAGMVDMDYRTKINYLDGIMNNKIKAAIITLEVFDNYIQYVKKLQMVGARMEMNHGSEGYGSRFKKVITLVVIMGIGNIMDWELTLVIRVARSRTGRTT